MARKGKRSEDGQFVNMPYALLKSPAWRSLSGAAMKVWFELSARFNGGNNGKLFVSMNEAAKALGIGKTTVQRAFAELQDKGFIDLVNPGNWYGRRAHEWRLTTKPMQTVKGKVTATNDWRNWRPKKTERGPETGPSHRSVVPFQDPRAMHGSELGPVRAKFRASLGTDTDR